MNTVTQNKVRHFKVRQSVFYIILVILGILLSIGIGLYKPSHPVGEWDFETFWVGPRLLLQGESPYDTVAWLDLHGNYPYIPQNNAFVYPLPLAIILLPLGLFSLEIAAILWAAINLAALYASIRLILPEKLKLPFSYALPVFAGLILIRPVMVNFYLLQMDCLVLLCLAASLHLWQRNRWFWGGMVIALIVLKPQVGAPILAFLLLWQLIRYNWNAILGACTGLALLLLSGLIIDPTWVGSWLSIGGNKVLQIFFSTPTLWGLSSLICQPSLACVKWLGMGLSILTVLFTCWVILPKKTREIAFVMGMAICASLIVSPYLWTYSQLLLILPILLINVALYRLQKPYLLTATFSILVALFSAILVSLSVLIGADMLSVLLPILVGVLLFLVYRKDPALLHKEPYSPAIISSE